MFDIALEIPLAAFFLGRLFQGDRACTTGIEVLHEPFDRAPFARRIAPFEQDQNTLSRLPGPTLHFQ